MQTKIKDWKINYEVLGEGNPVILLHGWLATLETMRPLANNLSQNFKVYLVDVVGFGKSDIPEHPLKTDDFGDFLEGFIKNLQIKNPILIGHSNGGRTIINAVGRGIVSPKKIVLIDSAGIKPKRSLSYYFKVAFFKTGKIILNILPNTKKIKKFKEKLRNKVGSSDYKASSPVLKETMKIILSEDLSHLLPKIQVPTLLIWGSLDTATPISDGRKMEKLIPDCGLVEYKGSSHFSYLENLANCNAVLNEFLKNDK
ncbi:MAG: alpha/beta hydrolase [Clostridia bacterium]|nr:alpha/beta hydrolase [Clostridia bacterium]